MRVAQLIELLKEMDPNAEVHTAYNYGDHWRTTVAPQVESVSEGRVAYSDYHSMDRLLDPYNDDDDDEASGSRVVVIIG